MVLPTPIHTHLTVYMRPAHMDSHYLHACFHTVGSHYPLPHTVHRHWFVDYTPHHTAHCPTRFSCSLPPRWLHHTATWLYYLLSIPAWATLNLHHHTLGLLHTFTLHDYPSHLPGPPSFTHILYCLQFWFHFCFFSYTLSHTFYFPHHTHCTCTHGWLLLLLHFLPLLCHFLSLLLHWFIHTFSRPICPVLHHHTFCHHTPPLFGPHTFLPWFFLHIHCTFLLHYLWTGSLPIWVPTAPSYHHTTGPSSPYTWLTHGSLWLVTTLGSHTKDTAHTCLYTYTSHTPTSLTCPSHMTHIHTHYFLFFCSRLLVGSYTALPHCTAHMDSSHTSSTFVAHLCTHTFTQHTGSHTVLGCRRSTHLYLLFLHSQLRLHFSFASTTPSGGSTRIFQYAPAHTCTGPALSHRFCYMDSSFLHTHHDFSPSRTHTAPRTTARAIAIFYLFLPLYHCTTTISGYGTTPRTRRTCTRQSLTFTAAHTPPHYTVA